MIRLHRLEKDAVNLEKNAGSDFSVHTISKLHSRLAEPISVLDISKKTQRKLLEAGFSSILDLVLTYPDSATMEAAKLTPKQKSRLRTALGELELIQGRELHTSVIDAAREQIMLAGR